jgi:hypothetical protein
MGAGDAYGLQELLPGLVITGDATPNAEMG